MQSNEVRKEIQELESLRSQMRWWRLGTLLALLVVVGVCLATINNAVRGLTQPGPVQEQFVQDVTVKLQGTVADKLQPLAAQTVAQLQPKVQKELVKLNDRVPELAEASMKELETLEKNLPPKGEKILNDTFGAMLEKREPKLRQMFPDADEAKVNTLLTNLADEGKERIDAANDRMFSEHLDAMNNIFEHISTIQHTEAINPNSDQTNWEMAVLLVDIFHDDLKALQAESMAKPVAGTPGKVTVSGKPKAAPASVKPMSGEKKPAAPAKKGAPNGY